MNLLISRPRPATRTLGYVLIVLAALLVLGPLLWTIDTSFKTQRAANAYPPVLLGPHPSLSSYQQVLGDPAFLHSLYVSALVTVATTVLALLIAIPAAYALSRFTHRFLRVLVILLVLLETIPLVALVIPLYALETDVGLYDTVFGLIIAYTALTVPLATWINLSFLQGISSEMEEAASVDGATLLQRLWYVVLPVLRPAIGATAIFSAFGAWNQFLLPVVLAGSDAETSTVYISQFVTQKMTAWGPMTAAAVIVMLPLVILVVAASRQLVGGLTMGMLK